MYPRIFWNRVLLSLLLIASADWPGSRATPGVKEVKHLVGTFEAHYRSARTLQVTFLESYRENGRLVRTEAGTAYFRRPGKMRWDYQSPERNLFLVDGKNAWFYVPADHTVTRVPAKSSADWRTPLALLAGEMKLSRICSSVEQAVNERPDNPDDVVLFCALRGQPASAANSSEDSLVEKKDDQAAAAFLEISPQTLDLVRVLVRDRGGISVEFKFANWRFDPPVANDFFRFDVPPGVAIVNGELPAGQSKVNP